MSNPWNDISKVSLNLPSQIPMSSLRWLPRLILKFILIFAFLGCGYQFGPRDRSMPGGFKKVAIPMFKNRTQEPIAETYFTNALLQEFQKSKFAEVVSKNLAEVIIEGEIVSINYKGEGLLKAGDLSNLPQETDLATSYVITLDCDVRARSVHDGKILWQSRFRGDKNYSAPRITTPGLNSANPLYNVSARRQNLELMAQNLMAEAYARMTENF